MAEDAWVAPGSPGKGRDCRHTQGIVNEQRGQQELGLRDHADSYPKRNRACGDRPVGRYNVYTATPTSVSDGEVRLDE